MKEGTAREREETEWGLGTRGFLEKEKVKAKLREITLMLKGRQEGCRIKQANPRVLG